MNSTSSLLKKMNDKLNIFFFYFGRRKREKCVSVCVCVCVCVWGGGNLVSVAL